MDNLDEQLNDTFNSGDITRLEAFLSGALPAPEIAALNNDPDFMQAVAAYQEARKAIDTWGEEDLRQSLKNSFYAIPEEAPVRDLRPFWLAAAVAASLTLLVIAFWPSPPMSSEQLFAAYYETPHPGVASRGNGASDSLLSVAITAYQEENFDVAIPDFQALVADSGFAQPGLARLHLAICLVETGKSSQAISVLEKVTETDAYYWDARWYLALTWLLQGDVPACREVLVPVSKESQRFGKMATWLLKELSRR